MSIEDKIDGLSKSVTALTEALNAAVAVLVAGPQPTQQAIQQAARPDVKADKSDATDVKAKAPKSQPKVSTDAAASPQSETPAAEPALRRGVPVKTSAPAAPEATYDDVRAALIALDEGVGREAAVEALQRLGVTSAKQLQPTQYTEALAVFTKALKEAA